MKIIAFYNIKGGVGKTASAVNIAYMASQENMQTLLIDLDPQGSASYYFRIKPSKKINTKKLLKEEKGLDKHIKGTDFDGLDLIPADLSYRNMDIILDDLKKSRYRLKSILRPLRKEYDLIVIDCPPNVTLLSENIFIASDFLIIPTIPTTLSIIALNKLIDFMLKTKVNTKKLLPFFSMVEMRKTLHKEIVNAAGRAQVNFMNSRIPYNADIEKMGIYRQPTTHFSTNSIASHAYYSLWNEIKVNVFRK